MFTGAPPCMILTASYPCTAPAGHEQCLLQGPPRCAVHWWAPTLSNFMTKRSTSPFRNGQKHVENHTTMVHINALTVILYDFIVFNESSPEQIMRKCSLAFFTPKLQGLQSLTSGFFWGNATRSDGLTVMIHMFGYSQNRQSCPSNILKLDS